MRCTRAPPRRRQLRTTATGRRRSSRRRRPRRASCRTPRRRARGSPAAAARTRCAALRSSTWSSASGGSRYRTPTSANTVRTSDQHARSAAARRCRLRRRRAAVPAPTRPPAENAAWNDERIERLGDPLERDALRVDGDVDRTEAGAEAEERRGEADEAGRERRGEQRAAAEQEPGERDAAAADPLAQPPGHRHRDERAERGGEQRQAEPRGRQAGMVLDGGDPSGPGADHQAVAEEEQPDREARRSHRPRHASITRTPSER